MKNWQTTIGGAISKAGTSLIGVGLLPQLSGLPPKLATYIALAGFILNIIGGALTSIFAADAAQLKAVAADVENLKQNTTQITKP